MAEEEYLDLKVVELKRRKKQEPYNNIETGVYVNNRLIEFEAVEAFDQKMSIFLPQGMKHMPKELAKIKYPSEDRPQLIYTNDDGSVNFTFNHFKIPLKPEDTITFVEQFKIMIKKVHPANIFYEMKEETLRETKLSWFDFKGYAIDKHLYNIIYVTTLDGSVLHGTFNCLYSDAAEWKKAVLPAMLSIIDLTVKKGDEIS